MKHLKTILLVLLVLLSLATGVTKIIQMPEEMTLFANAGFSDWWTVLFGVIQVGGGMALIFSKTRRIGAMIMTATFVIATIVVFVNQMLVFGFVSILFIGASAVFIMKKPAVNNS